MMGWKEVKLGAQGKGKGAKAKAKPAGMGAGPKKTLELRQGGVWNECFPRAMMRCVEIRGKKKGTFKEVLLSVNLP